MELYYKYLPRFNFQSQKAIRVSDHSRLDIFCSDYSELNELRSR